MCEVVFGDVSVCRFMTVGGDTPLVSAGERTQLGVTEIMGVMILICELVEVFVSDEVICGMESESTFVSLEDGEGEVSAFVGGVFW